MPSGAASVLAGPRRPLTTAGCSTVGNPTSCQGTRRRMTRVLTATRRLTSLQLWSKRRVRVQSPRVGHNLNMSTRDWRESLTDRDGEVLRACLRAAAEGPFFPDWEFRTLFGLDRDELSGVSKSWPESEDPQDQFAAVAGAMANLLGYPHRRDDVWSEFIPASRTEVEDLLWKIREASGANDRTRAYLTGQLDRLAALDDEGLTRNSSLVRDLVTSARRYGVPIPDRLA